MIVTISSGIRGGVGKSVLATVLGYTLNYLESPTLVVDVGGGSTRFVLPGDVAPPYTRDLPRDYNAIVQTTITLKVERRRIFRKPEVEERTVPFYLTPEVRELSDEEIDEVVGAIPGLEDYFDYVIIDMPAVSNRHYWRFLDVTDVQVVCLVPERAAYEAIIATNEVRAPAVIAVMNKFDRERSTHGEALDAVKQYFSRWPGSRVVTVPFDPQLAMVAAYGLEYLVKASLAESTTDAITSLVGALENLAEFAEEGRRELAEA